jgi:hypothetical protein
MLRLRVIALALIVVGCTSTAGSPPPTAPPESAAAPSGPCIDRSLLYDNADSVTIALQGVVTALGAKDAEKARSLAATATTGLRKIADLVEALAPDAASRLRDSAGKLDAAAPTFPDGLVAVQEVQAGFEAGLDAARLAACAE